MNREVEFGQGVGEEIRDQVREESKKVIAAEDAKAKYKIEILYGHDRSKSELKNSVGLVLIWESGKMFHGGGDDKMYWCGYDDCQHPFSSDNLAIASAVCPKCHREQFTDPGAKMEHIGIMKGKGRSAQSMEALPCMVGEKLFRLPPSKLATLVHKTFRGLNSNADIYLKFCPVDIRIDKDDPGSASNINKMVAARLRKEPVIYPLANILKDTAHGADLHKRLIAFLIA